MTIDQLTRRFVALRALRWLPVGLVLPFLIITPTARGLSIAAIGAVFAVHSAVAMTCEVPSGALADVLGRRLVMLVGAVLTALSLFAFASAQSTVAFMASVTLLAAGRALLSGSLEAWYVDAVRSLDPLAPLARGLSRGAAAEGVAMAFGALAAGAAVAVSGGADDGVLSGYGLAPTLGGLAALVYLGAILALVRETPGPAAVGLHTTIARRTRAVVATARAQAVSSPMVRVVLATAVAYGAALAAVELLWQPRMAGFLDRGASGGLVFGALAAGAMLAFAIGASSSPRVRRRVGLRTGYVCALACGALCVAVLGAPGSPLGFAALYLVTYVAFGINAPLHYELLNDAVGSTARATLISAESFSVQTGSLIANLGVGTLAAAHGPAIAWAIAGGLLALVAAAVAVPLSRDRPPPSPASGTLVSHSARDLRLRR